MILPLLLALDAEPDLAEPARATRWTLTLSGVVAARSSTFGSVAAGSNSGGVRGGGSGDLTVYLKKPLMDDDSPYGLQGFLQRTSFLQLDGNGSHIQDRYSPAGGGGTYTQEYTQASLSTRVFMGESVAILGSLGTAFLHDVRTPNRSRDVVEPSGSAGLDLRAGDASVTLQWQVVGANGSVSGETYSFPSVFWGRFAVAGRLVLGRRFDLTAGATLIPDGARADVGFAAYPTKALGLSATLQVERGQIYWDTTTDYEDVSAQLAASYWLSPRIAVAVSYAPAWVTWAQGTSLDHAARLTFTARLP